MSDKNMVKCKACGKDIAKGVKKCVNCGKDQRNFFMKHKIITGILILIVFSVIATSGGDDKPTSGGDDKTTSAGSKEIAKGETNKVKEEVQTEFKLDEVIEYKDFSLVFNNPREVSSLTGSDKYLVFDVTITSKKDDFTFFGDIQGVTEDDEVVDDTIAFVNEDLGDPIATAWTKTLNSGRKAKGYVAFDKEIDKIEVRSSIFKNDAIIINLD